MLMCTVLPIYICCKTWWHFTTLWIHVSPLQNSHPSNTPTKIYSLDISFCDTRNWSQSWIHWSSFTSGNRFIPPISTPIVVFLLQNRNQWSPLMKEQFKLWLKLKLLASIVLKCVKWAILYLHQCSVAITAVCWPQSRVELK